jgi:uncharacterized protein YndB with AHSA1/START domain
MQKITVEATIPADVRTVWKHYTDPQSITGWAFASDDWECPYAENDLHIGGKFLTRMQAKDGSTESGAGFNFTGTYTDIVEFEKIAYTMDDILETGAGRTCEVLFKDLGDGMTLVTTEFDPEELNSEELQRAGWQSILDNFKKFVMSVTHTTSSL